MKRLLPIVLLLLAAPATFAATSALTAKGTFYSIDANAKGNVVSLIRRSGETKETLVVPATADEAVDARAQIEYDSAAGRLYVIWMRGTDESASLVVSSLDAEDRWSDPIVLTNASALSVRGDLRTALTRVMIDEKRVTLLHVASWLREGGVLTGEYVLAAFDDGRHVSTSVTDLEKLANINVLSQDEEFDTDAGTAALFPPLAMAAVKDGVDVVFGREHGTTVTRLHITPRLEPDARIWKPVGRTGGPIPPSRLSAMSASPVQAFFSRDRLVLYTADKAFRFVIFENGAWTPVRSLMLDESLTGDAVLNEIRRTLDEEPLAEEQKPEVNL